MAQELVLDQKLQSAKNLAWWLYLLHGISFLFSLGAFSWIPLIINYLKRDEASGTFVESHFRWQIRSFWFALLWFVLSALLFATFIGIPLALAFSNCLIACARALVQVGHRFFKLGMIALSPCSVWFVLLMPVDSDLQRRILDQALATFAMQHRSLAETTIDSRRLCFMLRPRRRTVP